MTRVFTFNDGSTSLPSGIGLPFSLAMRSSVEIALVLFPLVRSYLALSGNHCRKGIHIDRQSFFTYMYMTKEKATSLTFI